MDNFEQHIKRMKGLRDVYEVGTGQHNILSMLINECEAALLQPPVSGRSEQFSCPLPDARCDRHKIDDEEGRWEFCNTCKREWAR